MSTRFQAWESMIFALAKMYKQRDWAMQIHFGAIRNNNATMFDKGRHQLRLLTLLAIKLTLRRA